MRSSTSSSRYNRYIISDFIVYLKPRLTEVICVYITNCSRLRNLNVDSDSDDSIDLKSQTSIRGADAKAKKVLGSSNYSQGDKRYDSEDASPEGKLTIKQPVRSIVRKNVNGFVPKDLKPKFEVTTSVARSQESNRQTDGEETKWMRAPMKFLDESKPPELTSNQHLQEGIPFKNKKPAISANVIIRSNSGSSNSNNIKAFDSSYQLSSNSAPIDDADDNQSQESSNTVEDFSNIAIEATPRLNTTKKPGKVRYAFNLSSNGDDPYQASPTSAKYKAKNNVNNQSQKENRASSMNKENISTGLDDDVDFVVIDESSAESHPERLEDRDTDSSDHTFDPSIVKHGEFYADFVEKTKGGNSFKTSRSNTFGESDPEEVPGNQELSQHRKNSLKPTIFSSSRKGDQPGLAKTSWVSVNADNAADISTRYSFVQVAHSSGAKTERVHCTVVRDKRATIQGKLSPSYVLILEDTNKPIIVAQKLSLTRTSNYHLFDMTRAQLSKVLSKKSGNYLGKLRATNVNRTEYVLLNQNSEREEIAGIKFDRLTFMDQFKEGNQPRKLKAILPALDKDRVPIPNKVHDSNTGMGSTGSLSEKLLKYESSSTEIDALVFESKDPVFENGNFRLNFSGRVSMPSVKNFQLVSKKNISDVICQFGKVDEDIFHLDFKAPMNACQAFALALCQFNL